LTNAHVSKFRLREQREREFQTQLLAALAKTKTQMTPRQGGQEAIRARLFSLQMPVILARGINGIISDICINNISNYTSIIDHNLTSHNKIVAE
jgi:hypothetical protein